MSGKLGLSTRKINWHFRTRENSIKSEVILRSYGARIGQIVDKMIMRDSDCKHKVAARTDPSQVVVSPYISIFNPFTNQ